MNASLQTFAKKCGFKMIQKPGFRPMLCDSLGFPVSESELVSMKKELDAILNSKQEDKSP